MDRREWLNSDEESFRLSFEGEQKKIWTCLPAIVTSVDLTRQTISAQSGISAQTQDENGAVTNADMPVFEDVSLCFPKGGGYIMTFPVAVGDEVLVFFASRCMDSWWQNGNANNVPPEFRMHDLSDSFAMLAPTSQPKVTPNISTDSLTICSEDGLRCIEITSTEINVNSDQNININADQSVNVTSSDSINAIATGDINIDSGAEVNIDAATGINVTSNANIDFNIANDFIVQPIRDFEIRNSRDFLVGTNRDVSISSNGANDEFKITTSGNNTNIDIEVSGNGACVNIKATGNNADILLESSGNNGMIHLTAASSVEFNTPTVNLNGATLNP